MNKINAAITRMEEVEIFGIPALFTPKRISRDTLHLQLFCYEMQAQLGEVEPFILTDHAEQEFYGTFAVPHRPDAGWQASHLLRGFPLGHWGGQLYACRI